MVSPRKSILSRPSLATGSIEYWVISTGLDSSPRVGRWRGTVSVSGSSAMRTPAAWVLTWWTMPSSPWRFHQILNRRLVLVSVLELRVNPQRVLKVAGLEGHHAGDPVHVAVGHSHCPAHVAQGSLCAEGAEGDYLGHVVAAVLFDDIVQDLVPAVVLEVQVDVRHFLAFQVEEPLEDQAVLQGVNIGYSQQ